MYLPVEKTAVGHPVATYHEWKLGIYFFPINCCSQMSWKIVDSKILGISQKFKRYFNFRERLNMAVLRIFYLIKKSEWVIRRYWFTFHRFTFSIMLQNSRLKNEILNLLLHFHILKVWIPLWSLSNYSIRFLSKGKPKKNQTRTQKSIRKNQSEILEEVVPRYS